MKAILKRDILIKAGTVFEGAPLKAERYGKGWVEHVIGLSNDSHGSLTYCIERGDDALKEWFKII